MKLHNLENFNVIFSLLIYMLLELILITKYFKQNLILKLP